MRLILNPSSRSGKGKKLWSFWKQSLESASIDFELCETTSLEHAYQLAYESDRDVVAVGGDGTINIVMQGVINSAKPKAMGVLYAGTSPDFCKFHNISTDPQKAFRILELNNRKEVDIAEISYKDEFGNDVKSYFSSSSNIGLGADIARFANKWRKYLGDTIGTGLGTVKSIIFQNSFAADLTIGDEDLSFSKIIHIFIVKNPHIASGLKLNLNIDVDDGKMFIIVLHDMSRLRLLSMLKKFYTGDVVPGKNVFIKECNKVAVKLKTVKEVEFDGDPKGFTDVSVKLIPKKLTLICGVNDA